MKKLVKNYDLVVVGGGVAGTVSAISAARLGLKTVLIHNRPVLGGPSSTECSYNANGEFITGAPEYLNRSVVETGCLDEMRQEAYFRTVNGWDQHWSLVLREWAENEENLTLLLNTEAYQVEMNENKISSIQCMTLNSEKFYEISAPLFVDCSGDSFLGFNAGADFKLGREAKTEFNESSAVDVADKKTMGSSIGFRASDIGHPISFVAPKWAYKINSDEDLPYRLHNNPKKGYWWLEYGGEVDTIHDNEIIYKKLLSILYGIWDHVKKDSEHGADNYVINWVSSIPAKRESRRLMGDYILTENDLVNHTNFPDVVAYGGWPIDIHPPEGVFGKDHPGSTPPFIFPGVYQIPLRSLYSRNIENLFMAGRNISVTHVALGSTRVMATCSLCAQAVASAAFLASKYNVTPREVSQKHIAELQKILYFSDQVLPWFSNQEEDKFSEVQATSEMVLNLTDIDGELPLIAVDKNLEIYDPCDVAPDDRRRAQMFPIQSGTIDEVAILFNNMSGEEKTINAWLYESYEAGVFEGKLIATSSCLVAVGKAQEGKFSFNIKSDAKSLFIVLEQVENISVCTQKRHLPGFYCKADSCYTSNDNFCFRVTPVQHVFAPMNTINTPPRPNLSANIWISDATNGFPQELSLTLKEPQEIENIELIFDTNLDKKNSGMIAVESVKSYQIEIFNGTKWSVVASEKANYQRVRKHKISPTYAEQMRIKVFETNGDKSARIYNVRF